MIIEKLEGIDPDLEIDIPPRGLDYDYAILVFKIAKREKKNPNEIAKEIFEKIKELEFVKEAKIFGPYINIKIDWEKVSKSILKSILLEDVFKIDVKRKKILIEHTSANPNKGLHIGHLRNTLLGDSLARLLRFLNQDVQVLYYINDTGVQISDIVLALKIGFPKNPEEFSKEKLIENLKKYFESKGWKLEKLKDFEKEIEERIHALERLFNLKEIPKKIDIYYGEFIYVLINKLYKYYPELEEERRKVIKGIEEGKEEYYIMLDVMFKILNEQLKTLKNLDVNIDLFVKESDIIHFGFFKEAFEILKEKGIVRYIDFGEKKGTWCVDLEKLRGFEESEDKLKVIIRSDGTTVYVANDIAYAMWKHGLIKKDFLYKKFNDSWITDKNGIPKDFGRSDISINVIGMEQKYEQKIVSKIIKLLDPKKEYIHYVYNLVYLSKDTAKILGFKEEKEIVKMSGRKGLEILIDFLMKKFKEKVIEEFRKRNQVIDEEKAFKITRSVLRYEFLKYSPEKPIIFDINRALSFEENTGTYVLYTYARANSILEKGKKYLENLNFEEIEIKELNEKEIELIKLYSEFRKKILETYRQLKLNILTDYLNKLCLAFNEFYQNVPVLKEIDKKPYRIFIVLSFVKIIDKIFDILGIDRIRKF